MSQNFKAILHIMGELNYIMSKKQKRYALVVLIVIIISSGLELIGVSALLPFVQAILVPEELMKNHWVRVFMQSFGITKEKDMMLAMGIGLILVYVFKNLYLLFSFYVQADFAAKVSKELSDKVLNSYMKRPYTYFLDINSTEVIRGCGSDIFGVYTIVKHSCIIVSELLASVAIGALLFFTDAFVACGVVILLLVMFCGMVLFFKPVMRRAGDKSREAETMKNKAIYHAVHGIKEIFVMQRKEGFTRKYEEATTVQKKAQRIYLFVENCPDHIIEAVCVGGLIGIICMRLLLNVDMVGFVPKLAVFAVAAFKIMPSIGKITRRINDMMYYRPMMRNVYEIMRSAEEFEREQEVYVKEHGDPSAIHAEEIRFERELMIRQVYWKYQNQKTPVLTDANLTVHKGESVALIGASGAGKTTVSDILLGLLHPSKGTVYMDGKDIFAMPKQWARIVGYVPQSVFLIDDTVRSNIAFGLWGKDVDDERIWQALERAQLKEFVKTLPDQLDTMVGERGIKFSGGQRQRVAIARALYTDPEILILDEATAALDNETETAVMEAINALQGQVTMIIVAHRLTTIRNCDKVYEVKDGIIAERDKGEVLEGI